MKKTPCRVRHCKADLFTAACQCARVKGLLLCVQESSYGESISTLGFGSRVSEITLGAAKRNTESGAIFEAKETARRVEQESERHAREVQTLH